MDNGFQFGSQDGPLIDLGGCLLQVEASKDWFTRLVLPLSLEQLRWRPNPRHWSIAECLHHLNITLDLWLPRVSAATLVGRREGRTLHGEPHYEQSEIEALRLVEPPVVTPAVAPANLIPSAAVDPDLLVDQFYEFHDRYAEALRQAFGLDLSCILTGEPIVHSFAAWVVPSPFSQPTIGVISGNRSASATIGGSLGPPSARESITG